MNRIAPEIWVKLEKSRPNGDRLIARLAVPEIISRLQCALDAKGTRHLLIALRPDENELFDANSRGLNVVTRVLIMQGQPATKYLDMECQDVAGYPALDIIGSEISEELSKSNKQPAEIVKHVLSKWRRFWGQFPRELLSREQQLGLFAELWFLSVWLMPRIGSDALIAWRGPLGSRHDFEWPDKSVEVKATTNTRGRILHINGLDQLEVKNNYPLNLFSLRLREEVGSTYNLPTLIDSCRHQLAPDGDALGRLEYLLMQVGYSPIYAGEYANLGLHVIEQALFTVEDDFPRLTMASFTNGFQMAIERVEYEINLNTYDHLIVARKPDEWPVLGIISEKEK